MLREITATGLQEKFKLGQKLQLIDVREPEEFAICKMPESKLIPLGEIPKRYTEIDPAAEVIMICHHGFRSAQAIQFLSQRFGFTNLVNLKGGIHAWAEQVDPEMPVY